MTRTDALKAINDAMAERLMREFDVLADGFEGSDNAREAAKKTFLRGVDLHVEALAFAAEVIAEKFTDDTPNPKGT